MFLAAAVVASPIKNVVHIMMENRAFDTILGYVDHNPEIDNLVGKQFCNPIDLGNPSAGEICTSPTQPQMFAFSPDHGSVTVPTQQYGKYPTKEDYAKPAPMNGFIHVARNNALRSATPEQLKGIMAGFHPSQIPVHRTLAAEFTVCDRWFASFAGGTQPNRASVQTGTTNGMIDNDRNSIIVGYPQRSIYADLNDAGLTWANYFQEIPSLAAVRDVRLQMVANSRPMDKFFDDAEQGKLANYVFLEPFFGETKKEKSNDGHAGDGGPFYMAELLLKEIYEALRNGPQWNETLLIITYDEHGGFYDHVPSPANVPNPDGITTTKDGITYNFDHLGVRVPVILVSPWVQKGGVIHEPKGPFPDSQFEHSSIPATLRSIFGLKSKPLTKREEWAGRFDDIFLSQPRTDAPIVLPAALVP
ncbi:phosphoesterase [Gorgonomyces haynaldii]|nr:phosphoesterase [Gorgonomyces haynaldii]